MDTKIIGLIGSMYFAGFAISCLIVPPLSDKHGRKKPYVLSLTVQLLAYILIFFSKNIWITILGYLIVGLCAGGRVATGTAYENEYVPYKYQALVIGVIGVGDASTMLFQAIYYWFLPNWLYLHIFGICASFVLILFILTIPESPKYLYANSRFNETRDVLKTIAKYNNAEI